MCHTICRKVIRVQKVQGDNMKKVQDIDIIKNMDGIPVVNKKTGQFLIPFDFEQQKILKYCLDKDYSIRGFAYSSLPSNYMEAIVTCMFENFNLPKKLTDLQIWKSVHTDLTIEQFREVLYGYSFDLDLLDRMEYIKDFPVQVLNQIVVAKTYGEDIVNYVLTDCKDYDELVSYVDNIEKSYTEKEKRTQKIKDIIYS